MGHVLKNKNLELQIDYPHENYGFSRFDWTGKITKVKFKNTHLTSVEDPNCQNQNFFGKGLYNEFGIDSALGFDETGIGDWFHKIGVGLLKKEDENYEFNKSYDIKPAEFRTSTDGNRVNIHCVSPVTNGYSYELLKEIELGETSFTIRYSLRNTGKKTIQTDEYVHNFMAINNEVIGENFSLNFPFDLKPELFGETVNPDLAISIGEKTITPINTADRQFFFSNLSGGKSVIASWELLYPKSKIGIGEKTSFKTNKVNLWGWKHVVCPELFFEISVTPNETKEWTRTYEFFQI